MNRETVTLRAHCEALRTADADLAAERDRRYAEVALEREKALRIKETADLAALETSGRAPAQARRPANSAAPHTSR